MDDITKQRRNSHQSSSSNKSSNSTNNRSSSESNCINFDLETKEQEIHFPVVYTIPKSFYDPQNVGLIPNFPIYVRIIETIKDNHYLNPYLYTIEVTHGNFVWTVKRRYKHFLHLHQQLKLSFSFHLSMQSMRFFDKKKSKFKHENLPKFSHRLDALISEQNIEQRSKQLEEYLQLALKIPLCREHEATLSFLEISRLSFIKALGSKGKEALIKKKSGGHQSANFCVRCRYVCSPLSIHWRKRWLVLKDTFLLYLNPKNGKIRSVLLMDREFKATPGPFEDQKCLRISNLSRNLDIRCLTKRKTAEWLDFINNVACKKGADYTQPNRYDSFAPPRQSTPCQWLVDGASYFYYVANALEEAKEEIFIADWWFSPEIYMKRPMVHGDVWRLDKILERKARQGVMIFIMLYKEVELALGINSIYSKQKLMRLHPNIKVLRHPNISPIFWSHHEKIVVIDQSIAFVGGLDLCYGRWDTFEHRLTDLGGITLVKNVEKLDSSLFTDSSDSKDLQNICKNMLKDVNEKFKISDLNLQDSAFDEKVKVKNTPRRLSTKLLFCAVAKLNTLRKASIKKRGSLDSLDDEEEEINESKTDAIKTEFGINAPQGAKLWIGKDYANFIVKDFIELNQPYQDLVDRITTPRMPWHDVGLMVSDSAAIDVARHFIDRWNFIKFKKAQFHDKYPWLIPKVKSNLIDFFERKFKYKATCQVVRSVSDWSCGTKITESSILDAYIDIIDNSKHFIYIENQFFVTRSIGYKKASGEFTINNQVGEALVRRIIRAHRNNETFRVYVIIPLLPAFEGEIGTSSGVAIQAITHWNMTSICRGTDSLLQRLGREVGDTNKYITFYGLRNYGELNGEFVSELIYVHSKLIIVDDLVTLIGSSNINDRSLTGYRDSEIAVVIHDTETKTSIMNGRPYKAGVFASSLRQYLFKEHLGLMNSENKSKNKHKPTINVKDPISDEFYKTWISIATKNSEIYEKVFGVFPSNEIQNFTQLREKQRKNWNPLISKSEARDELIKIKGHLVLFPLLFLQEENLQPSSGTKESFIPASVWT